MQYRTLPFRSTLVWLVGGCTGGWMVGKPPTVLYITGTITIVLPVTTSLFIHLKRNTI